MSCVWCSTSMAIYQTGLRKPVYQYCPNCHWIKLEKSAHLSVDEQKTRYLQHENDLNNVGYVRMFEDFIASTVNPFVRPGSKMLDYGSGPEPVLAGLLRQKGYRVSTYDLFFEANEDVLKSTYDAIVMTEVLEHLEEPRKVLGWLVQCLVPGGVLSGMTLFHSNDPAQFKEWWYRRDPTHVAFYDRVTIESLSKKLGLHQIFTDDKRTFVLKKESPPMGSAGF